MCPSLEHLTWNPGCIIPDKFFGQDFIPKFSTVNQRKEQLLLFPNPAIPRFIRFQWSLAAIGSNKWSLGVLSREKRLIQMILSWLQALIFVVVLGWLFVPIYIKAGVSQTSMLCFSLLLMFVDQVLNIAKPLWMAWNLSMLELYYIISVYNCKVRILCSHTWAEKYLGLLGLLWFLELLFLATACAAPLPLPSTLTLSK